MTTTSQLPARVPVVANRGRFAIWMTVSEKGNDRYGPTRLRKTFTGRSPLFPDTISIAERISRTASEIRAGEVYIVDSSKMRIPCLYIRATTRPLFLATLVLIGQYAKNNDLYLNVISETAPALAARRERGWAI